MEGEPGVSRTGVDAESGMCRGESVVGGAADMNKSYAREPEAGASRRLPIQFEMGLIYINR
jgi:hypothetical protein